MNNTIDISYIRECANGINKDREKIVSISNRIEIALEDNSEIISKNFNDYFEYKRKIMSLVDNIDDEILELYKALVYEVIPGYEETAQLIDKHFNIEFQEQMANIVKEINK